LSGGVGRTLSGFLGLPGGLRCRDLELGWCHEPDLSQAAEVVAACSDTLEYVYIGCEVGDDVTPATINLAEATNLKEVAFICVIGITGCRWIITALETITSRHRDLRQISISFLHDSDYTTDLELIQRSEAANPGMRWSDLDDILIQLLESHSVHPKIMCSRSNITTQTVEDLARYLFPETAKRWGLEPFEEPQRSW